jgi:hydroxypyruvate reductase
MFRAAAAVIDVRAAVVTAPDAAARDFPPDARVFAAGHPAPNEASVAAGEAALELARASAAQGGLLLLLSGGASAMLVAPADGITLQAKIETGRALMAAGAAIHELNCVRKHLSRVKGGRLAAAAGRTVTLALSDVHGPIADDPQVIGSGPSVPDETTFQDAIDILHARGVAAPPAVMSHLQLGVRGEVEESVKPGDPRLLDTSYRVIGSRDTAVDGARREALARGYSVAVLPKATAGEARDTARAFIADALAAARSMSKPACVIGSGETTVTVRGGGLGGRNQEFALGALHALQPVDQYVFGSAGTDGIDGPTDAAGALVDSTTLERAADRGLDPSVALAANDAYRFFEPLGDLVMWGPTGTNVGDLHVLLIA